MTLEPATARSTALSAGDRVAAPALEARGLRCAIGRHTILRDLTLAVRPGQVLGLVGANGTGKSTLLRVLAGVRRPAAGQVLLDGRPLASFRTHERARRVAFVEQEEASHTDLLVGEMVALGRVPHARAWGGQDANSRDEVCLALEQVDLGYAVNQPLNQLSGGERRRALIARALAQEAPLLLLDEPTNHLDIRHQLALLRRIRALGRTVVVSMHDLDLAATFCDRIAVLHDGRLLACGSPEEVLSQQLLHDAFGVLATRVAHPLTGRTHLLFSHDESETHP